jgi:hypothetical protein
MDSAGCHETQEGEIPCPSLVRLGSLIKIIGIGEADNRVAEDKRLQDPLIYEIRVST